MPELPFEFPTLLEAVEKVSASEQKVFFRATGGQLALLAAATVAALIPTEWPLRVGPIATILLFLGALAIQLSGIANRSEKRWYGARAAAESVKAASWEYAIGGEAFRLDDTEADQRFMGVLRKVIENVSSLNVASLQASNSATTPSMKLLRADSRLVRAAAYRTCRVDDQIAWYAMKARLNRRRYQQFSTLVVVLEGIAILLGLLRVGGSLGLDLLGVVAACAAGLIGWMQAKKYSNLAEAYAVTSYEISLIPPTLDSAQNEEEWAQAVHDAEAAFSREHTMWQARRQGPV